MEPRDADPLEELLHQPGFTAPENTDDTACGVCGEPLLPLNRKGSVEVEAWLHVAEVPGGRGTDHLAVPVLRSEVSAPGRCDFCSGPNPSWILPTEPFEAWTSGPLPGQATSSDWLACDPCARALRKSRWDVVTRRSIDAYSRLHEIDPMTPGYAESLKALHAQVREHQTGPVRRIAG